MAHGVSIFLIALALFGLATPPVQAGNSATSTNPFRIGTGGNAGTYLPIGSLIAKALSQKGHTQENSLLMLAQRSSGSVTNVREIHSGLLESGLSQADVTHWAFNGTGPFAGSSGLQNLRAIASLYLESLHLVVHVDSGINSITDLRGSRVSVDEIGSGTLLDVRPLLKAFRLDIDELKVFYLKASDAIGRLRENQLDAFFIVAGYPVSGIPELISEGTARLVPIEGSAVDSLLQSFPFFTADAIPPGTYSNSTAIPTVGVAAQWVVNATLDKQLIYNITRALWNPATLKILSDGHPKGREVSFASSLLGTSIPLHPGAEKFYREAGMTLPTDLP